MSNKTVILDVRADIESGTHPFARIQETVDALSPDQELRVIAPFKPEPLLSVLGRQGFTHEARLLGAGGDWQVTFKRVNSSVAEPSPDSIVNSNRGSKKPNHLVEELDTRGLEPPEPMMKILEAVATLPEKTEIKTHTDRRPMHLYAQLQERGFTGETEEQPDGSFITTIRRA